MTWDRHSADDIYLARCLKNWTARYPLPRRGRERLLEQAMILQSQNSATPEGRYVMNNSGQVSRRSNSNHLIGQFAPVNLWSSHITNAMRLLA